jgi:hypothetical protein
MYSDAHTHLTEAPFGENVLAPPEIPMAVKTFRENGVL